MANRLVIKDATDVTKRERERDFEREREREPFFDLGTLTRPTRLFKKIKNKKHIIAMLAKSKLIYEQIT